jgi:Double zinc ribbon
VNCPKCRAEHDRAARFCEECGARLETTCSNCGKPLTPGKKFCRSCGARKRAAWSYVRAWPEVARVSNFVSFEVDKIEVFLDDRKLALETGQGVKEHGIDRSLDPDEMLKQGSPTAHP